MTLFRFIMLLAPAIGLTGCVSSSSENAVNTDQSAPLLSLTEQTTALPQSFIMRGTLVFGSDTRTFIPCGSNQQYWVNFPETYHKTITALSGTSYQPMYAELIGVLVPSNPVGMDRDYLAQLNVTTLNQISAQNSDQLCDHPVTGTVAMGSSPSWKLHFGSDNITYQEKGKQQKLTLSTTNMSPDRREYRFNQGQMNLTREECLDEKSKTLFGWKAEYTQDSTQRSGCAALSDYQATLGWAGMYQASSTVHSGFSVTLNLNKDHSASTEYSYQDGSPSRMESGYWQQLNSRQIQVMMTQFQGQRLLAERIYTKDGNSITAPKEKINNMVYGISGNGLTLYKN